MMLKVCKACCRRREPLYGNFNFDRIDSMKGVGDISKSDKKLIKAVWDSLKEKMDFETLANETVLILFEHCPNVKKLFHWLFVIRKAEGYNGGVSLN